MIGWESLSASTKDAAYLAVALGVAQAAAADGVYLWDDVGFKLDDERLAALAGSLKALIGEQGGQAIWFSSRKDLAAAADHLVRLAK